MGRNFKFTVIAAALILLVVIVWGIADSLKFIRDNKISAEGKGGGISAIRDSLGRSPGTEGQYSSPAHAPLGIKAKVKTKKRKHSYYFPKRETLVSETHYADSASGDKKILDDELMPEGPDSLSETSEEDGLNLMQMSLEPVKEAEKADRQQQAEKKNISPELQELIKESVVDFEKVIDEFPPGFGEYLEKIRQERALISNQDPSIGLNNSSKSKQGKTE